MTTASNFTLPIHSRFTSTDSYVDSLIAVVSDPFFRTIIGSVHILDFFIDEPDPYHNFLPQEWQDYFDATSVEEFLKVLFEEEEELKNAVPRSLMEFLQNIREHQLLRGFKHSSNGKVKNGGREAALEFRKIKASIASGMSEKKIHEVEHFSEYLGRLVGDSRNSEAAPLDAPTHLVDFGSGLSYLARVLACPPYNLDVVAIESDMKRIEAGRLIDRKAKLPWSSEVTEDTVRSDEHGSIQYFEKRISDGDIKSVVAGIEKLDFSSSPDINTNGEIDKDGNKSLMIISLHSCGNLIHHALNAFLSTPEATSVAVVGCCYNLMSEKSPAEKVRVRDLPFKETGDPDGFPLSSLLTQHNVTFNMAARMLACQAPNNWTPDSASAFFTRHFYRALLQRLLVDKGVINPETDSVIIGSLRKGCYSSFYAYVTGAVEKVTRENTPLIVDEEIKKRLVESKLASVTIEEMEEFEEKYKHGKKIVSVMWTLMAFCAGCVESMIVVDRWLYLKENPLVSAAKVETVFDYSLSPRNLVLFASKHRQSDVSLDKS